MKKGLWVLLAAGFVSAQVTPNKGPEIRFEYRKHDYGSVEQYREVVHYFPFKNVGDETLVIERLEAG